MHVIISWKYAIEKRVIDVRRDRMNVRREDFVKINDEFRKIDWERKLYGLSMDEKYEMFLESVKSVCEKFIPKFKFMMKIRKKHIA
jgi:hypothetical protein